MPALDFTHVLEFSVRFALRGCPPALLGVALLPLMAFGHAAFDVRLAALSEKLVAHPEDAGLRFNLAELYCEHEEPAKSLAELDRVTAMGAGDLPVDYLRGMCLLQSGEAAEALVALNRFVMANPGNAPARLQRARVHAALGNTADSLGDYREALRRSQPLQPDLVQESADALMKAGRDDEALQVLDDGLGKLGPIPSLTLRAIDLEIATGLYDAALLRVDGLQKKAPRPEPWMAKRADILARAGRDAEARSAWSALSEHLAALPAPERSSHAMSKLAEQARQAVARLKRAS